MTSTRNSRRGHARLWPGNSKVRISQLRRATSRGSSSVGFWRPRAVDAGRSTEPAACIIGFLAGLAQPTKCRRYHRPGERERGTDHARGKKAGRSVTQNRSTGGPHFQDPGESATSRGFRRIRHAPGSRPRPSHLRRGRHLHHEDASAWRRLPHAQLYGGVRARSAHSLATASGDPSRAEGDDLSKVGIPAGYRWGYILTPDGDDATVVTEVFDYGPLPEDVLRDGGAWINGTHSVLESMTASLERLEKISTE